MTRVTTPEIQRLKGQVGASKEDALNRGLRYYMGYPCSDCGNRLKLAYRGWCVACRAQWMAAHGITSEKPSRKIDIDRVHEARKLRDRDFTEAWVDDYYRD